MNGNRTIWNVQGSKPKVGGPVGKEESRICGRLGSRELTLLVKSFKHEGPFSPVKQNHKKGDISFLCLLVCCINPDLWAGAVQHED